MKYLFFLLFGFSNINYALKPITTKPSYKHYNNFLPLNWKVGKSKDFCNKKPQKIIFDNYPLCLYRNNEDKVVAISDVCIHRGASLSSGILLENNCIQCPYHGWEYEDGIVKKIPGCPQMNKGLFGTPRFKVKEINEDIFIRPSYDINSQKGTNFDHEIFIPPEANDRNFIRTSGVRRIERPNYLVTENVLDMLHVSYVHSFGNTLSPIPFKIEYEDINSLSGKTTFHYTAGQTSMSKVIGGARFVKVENEFHLPDATVTRVFASDKLIKTIVTNCYPIGKNESILHYDLYRNFLKLPLFDELFQWQMKITLDEDIGIINNIYDDYNKGFMSTKFDITQTKYREKKKKLMRQFTDE